MASSLSDHRLVGVVSAPATGMRINNRYEAAANDAAARAAQRTHGHSMSKIEQMVLPR